jgi:hypothetical protein
LQADTVVRPALQADVVSAGCNRHGISLTSLNPSSRQPGFKDFDLGDGFLKRFC